MIKYLLFTTPTCPNCLPAKEYLTEKGIDFEVIDATEDLINRAKYRIMSAPTLLILEGNKILNRCVGIDSIKSEIK